MFKRTMITQDEAWTQATAKAAQQSNLIPDASGKGGVDLSVIVPNIEARWPKMSKEEQYGVFRQMEEVQRKDWKELSIDEKKAGECHFRRQGVVKGRRREGNRRVVIGRARGRSSV